MEVTLHYQGEVPASQPNNQHSDFKQDLRVKFSQQLRRIWKKGLLARFLADGLPTASVPKQGPPCEVASDPDCHPFFCVKACGFSIVPLVTFHNLLGCSLSFEFLGDERGIIDLDNQIKTVLDALKMPWRNNQMPASKFGKGEQLFCLLEDDSIVKKYCVESRYGGGGSPPEEQLIIKATVAHTGGECHPALDRFR